MHYVCAPSPHLTQQRVGEPRGRARVPPFHHLLHVSLLQGKRRPSRARLGLPLRVEGGIGRRPEGVGRQGPLEWRLGVRIVLVLLLLRVRHVTRMTLLGLGLGEDSVQRLADHERLRVAVGDLHLLLPPADGEHDPAVELEGGDLRTEVLLPLTEPRPLLQDRGA